MLPEDLRAGAAERLARDVRSFKHITTGFLGAPLICHVLSDYGYFDEAFMLLNRREYPSWLYPITKGATTIWERWDGIKPDGSFQDKGMNSFNHYAYGAIGEWLYRVVAGLELDVQKPGYKHIVTQPHPGGEMTRAKAVHQSLYGQVVSGWEQKDGQLQVTIEIPANTTATVRLPQARLDRVRKVGSLWPAPREFCTPPRKARPDCWKWVPGAMNSAIRWNPQQRSRAFFLRDSPRPSGPEGGLRSLTRAVCFLERRAGAMRQDKGPTPGRVGGSSRPRRQPAPCPEWALPIGRTATQGRTGMSIRIKNTSSNFEREPLIRPFGFKGGYMTEIWQTAALLESESGARTIGLCSQSVLWSDAGVFASRSESGGNALMFVLTEKALQMVKGVSFRTPIDLLEGIQDELYEYGKKAIGKPDLRKTFVLNALVGFDNAAWLLYARENGISSFDDLIPAAYKPALARRHESVASIPLMAYTIPIAEIREAVEQGYFFMKIKIGQPGTQAEMLEKDKQRISAIHQAIGGMQTPHTRNGKLPYYFDANGRYENKETLLRLWTTRERSGLSIRSPS